MRRHAVHVHRLLWPALWLQVQRPDFAEIFAGNRVLPGWQPAAHCYCGHQVGAYPICSLY
jgi:uncharacterized protein YdiU (UPF0061 family)